MTQILLFIIGTCIGSFLNVLIDRLSTGRTIMKGRSYCENCKKTLKPYDLIPLVSYIFLLGKCRYCKAKIPLRIFFVELLVGIILPLLYLYGILNSLSLLSFIFLAIIVISFVGIFFADIIYGIIPDGLVVVSGIFTAFFLLSTNQQILFNFAAGIVTLLFFVLLFLATKGRGMGFGDVKLSFVLGFLVGFPNILIALYIAFLTGAAVSIILVIWRKVSFSKGTIPFGPFLIFSTLVVFFWGKDIFLPFILRFI